MTKKELRMRISKDKAFYFTSNILKKIFMKFTGHKDTLYLKYLVISRKYRFYKVNNENIFNKIRFIYYSYKNNKYSTKYNLEFNGFKFGDNLKVYHNNIIVNHEVVMGDNCKLHGNNCIGNNGENNICPQIGDNVDIGVGAIIIGDVKIADGITIGAGSVVTKSFTEPNIIIAGIPAKKIRNK